MCGIAGILTLDPDPSLPNRIERMVTLQTHRGPDGTGQWFGRPAGVHVGLGFTRLAILDRSPAAQQPMSCTCGRHVLLYNGEVYNYVELRAELGALGRTFRSGSDTEVVLQALCQWGPAALDRFNGMWAIA